MPPLMAVVGPISQNTRSACCRPRIFGRYGRLESLCDAARCTEGLVCSDTRVVTAIQLLSHFLFVLLTR